ncbi:hypothetical protein AtubIFM61612_003651 [Aspergillus tubingensis]|nr:hypothetical protein AtubIFM57143_008449 [Aspergillus tubingensis]GLB23067.1 hypothetical protein AtubIFM61612_003651 [Aspergillus tubingensis]
MRGDTTLGANEKETICLYIYDTIDIDEDDLIAVEPECNLRPMFTIGGCSMESWEMNNGSMASRSVHGRGT